MGKYHKLGNLKRVSKFGIISLKEQGGGDAYGEQGSGKLWNSIEDT